MRTVFFAIRFGMTFIGLVLIGTGVLAAVFHQHLQTFTARQIAAEGTRFTGVPFHVGAVSFSLQDGGIVLEKVGFGQPAGFGEGMAFSSARVVMVPVWNTLFSDKPTFELASVHDPVCSVSYQPGVGSNLSALVKLMEGGGGPSTTGALRPAREFLIRKVACDATRLEVALKPLPTALTGASIPAFTLEDFGTDGPETGNEVLVLFLKSIAKKVLSINGIIPSV